MEEDLGVQRLPDHGEHALLRFGDGGDDFFFGVGAEVRATVNEVVGDFARGAAATARNASQARESVVCPLAVASILSAVLFASSRLLRCSALVFPTGILVDFCFCRPSCSQNACQKRLFFTTHTVAIFLYLFALF